MALAYLLDPQLQYSDKSGALNVAGFLRVYLNGTDDRATTYKDFNGTLNTADIVLDNNGRAVVIADSSKAYRLEVYTSDGDLQWTQYPLNTLVGGAGGASSIVLESSDGTVDITKYSEGGITHYDLSTDVSDSTELLEWVTCSGSTVVTTNIYRPTFVDGTMTLGDYGVRLAKDQYYHVTAHITCTKSGTAYPYADDIQVHFKGRDNLTGNSVEYQLDTVNVDYSTLLPETKELSLDIKPSTDVELVIVIDNSEVTGASFSIKDLQIHRVYSGAPHIPGGVQRKLIAGENITLEHTTAGDIISSTGGGGSAPSVQYIQEGYAEGYIETSGTTTLSFTRLSDSWDTYVDPTCAYLLRVTLGGASQSGLGELVYGSNPSISLENWEYDFGYVDTYVSSAIPQLSGMDTSPKPRLNLHVSFLGVSANRIHIVKPTIPIPYPPYGGGGFLQLKLRDVTCDMAATLKMEAELFKITPTQYVWQR